MFIFLLIIIGFIIFNALFPSLLPFILFNFHNIIFQGIKDIFLYFKHKEYNRCKEWGNIRLNCATDSQVFGCGKTLMLVIRANYIYKRYNNKLVYDDKLKKFVTQKIHIISNVELFNVPYIKFEDVTQVIDIEKFGFPEQDVTLFLLDESGAIFNSRNFRNNISTEFLTRLLQSRKHKMALYMTSQRFQFTDKILREVCSQVTCCRKWWRIVKTVNYDAYDMENALSVSMLKPKSINYRFIFDSDYHSYNSYQLVEDLRKDYKPDAYLNTSEILETYGDLQPNLSLVNKPSRRLKRTMNGK